MLTPADKAGGSVAGAREDPGALIGPGSLSPDGWIYGGLGGTPPGANPTPRGTQWFPPRRPPGARDRPACKKSPAEAGARLVRDGMEKGHHLACRDL